MPKITIESDHILYYELIAGKRQKPYLVFLHEGLGCTSMWGHFPQRVCKTTGCPGLLYDRQGHGRSSPATRPRSQNYLDDYAEHELPAVLNNIIPDSPYILIGHSDGGTIALLHGAKQPLHLLGIIAEAAHVFVEQETISGITAAKKSWDQGKLEKLKKYHGTKTSQLFNSWVDTWLAPSFRNWNIINHLPKIETPLLLLQGENDHYGTTQQVHAIASHSSGYSKTGIIENCGHIPHIEAQRTTLQLMTDFIEVICRKA